MDTPSTSIGPGLGAFVAFFGVAVILWLLMRNMNGRMRRMAYREQKRVADIEASRTPSDAPASSSVQSSINSSVKSSIDAAVKSPVTSSVTSSVTSTGKRKGKRTRAPQGPSQVEPELRGPSASTGSRPGQAVDERTPLAGQDAPDASTPTP